MAAWVDKWVAVVVGLIRFHAGSELGRAYAGPLRGCTGIGMGRRRQAHGHTKGTVDQHWTPAGRRPCVRGPDGSFIDLGDHNAPPPAVVA